MISDAYNGPYKNLVEEDLVDSMVHVEYDPVENPAHYNHGGIETIDYIEAVQGHYHAAMYCQGTVIKYISRVWDKENPLQDAKKARWFLDRMIQNMEKTKGINW